MQIIRFEADGGRIHYGVADPAQPGMARVVEGDLFGAFGLTDRAVKIGRVLSPLQPANILALGLNYRRHADETKTAYPEIPVVFMKATTSVIGPGETILLPAAGPDRVDYEVELAVVIGRRAKNVRREDALAHVLGYTCANDVSARDWQIEKQKKQWVRGKSFDTFCPLGPCLVTTEDIPDPNRLRLRTVLNGRVLQDSSTADMIFDVATLVSDLSRSLTLLPGTVILTGTPEGVGFTRQPPVYLREGDTVTVEVEKIGTLTNPVQREPALALGRETGETDPGKDRLREGFRSL